MSTEDKDTGRPWSDHVFQDVDSSQFVGLPVLDEDGNVIGRVAEASMENRTVTVTLEVDESAVEGRGRIISLGCKA